MAQRFLDIAHDDGDDDLTQTAFAAILYQLVVIGEAIRGLPETWTQQYAHVGWMQASAMRNVLTHEYFRVDRETVHHTLDRRVSELRAACIELLDANAQG